MRCLKFSLSTRAEWSPTSSYCEKSGGPMQKSSLNICAFIWLICAKKLNPSTVATSFCELKAESVTAWYHRKTIRIAEKRDCCISVSENGLDPQLIYFTGVL